MLDGRVPAGSLTLRVTTGRQLVTGCSVAGRKTALEVRKALARSELWALLEDGSAAGNVYMGLTSQLKVW